MALSIGIVGLPNVGKSTTFNALTQEQNAQVANYPFCTIEPNKAIVPVPDERVERLAELVDVPNAIHATIEFLDIAGLVAGASRGEGLGNQFLANIRDADAIVHVVRCFDDPNVVHISEKPEPRADIEIINTELILADLQQLERKMERLERQVKGDRKTYGPQLEVAEALQDHLERGNPIATYPEQDRDAFQALEREMRFLTTKPAIYAANVDEESLAGGNAYVEEVRRVAAEHDAEVVVLCAKLEEEMAGLTDEEREAFLELTGAEESGLEQIIRKSYEMLGLISFFSYNENEVRAWTIRQGWTAPQAAGVIHTDFERGFIRAEVIAYETFVEFGSMAAARAAGKVRSEGRDYVVQDGDVIFFRFNV
ncbi:MAG: redox-regulated ATPase YchF [Candidatus Promineifilaceae bacterium]|nr:redox-regulated ATPase YchF [Candidatus Promineifilaceae bacterium]